jgi:opacity protein-like surface antigen
MKNLITTIAGLAALAAGPALGADMPVAAPAPAPVVTWTGGYVGLGAGGEWASSRWTTTCFNAFDTCSAPDASLSIIDASGQHTFSASGFRGSLYGGWNLQTSNAVVGLEFDFGWDNAKRTIAGIPGCIISTSCIGDGESTWVQMRYDGSIRLRAGFLVPFGAPALSAPPPMSVKAPPPAYAPPPELLIYATGGGAFQSFKANVNCALPAVLGPSFSCSEPGGSFDTASPFGWTIGGGLEYKVGQFVFRGEYRYSDFGSTDVAFFQPDQSQSQGIHARLHVTTQIAYFGISYLWGPVTARPAGGGGAEY